MIETQFRTSITADGEYAFTHTSIGRTRILELYGDFEGASVTIGYVSPSGIFIPYKVSTGGAPIVTTVEESWVVDTPSSGKFAVLVSGAGPDTDLKLAVTGKV
jgi:hypothetical protein